jgi:hypothetical protein
MVNIIDDEGVLSVLLFSVHESERRRMSTNVKNDPLSPIALVILSTNVLDMYHIKCIALISKMI